MTSSTKTMDAIITTLLVGALMAVPALIMLGLVYVDAKISPHEEENKFSVNNATVLNLSYNTTTTTFTYNFALFVTIPKMFECHNYVYVKATASYLNHRFASKPEETVVQGFTGLRMRFKGEYVVPFTQDQLLTLNNNHMAGFYNITIRIWPSITYPSYIKLGFIKKLVLCDIQVPLQYRVFCGWTNDE